MHGCVLTKESERWEMESSSGDGLTSLATIDWRLFIIGILPNTSSYGEYLKDVLLLFMILREFRIVRVSS